MTVLTYSTLLYMVLNVYSSVVIPRSGAVSPTPTRSPGGDPIAIATIADPVEDPSVCLKATPFAPIRPRICNQQVHFNLLCDFQPDPTAGTPLDQPLLNLPLCRQPFLTVDPLVLPVRPPLNCCSYPFIFVNTLIHHG